MNFNELNLAAKGLLSGDLLLGSLACPFAWALAGLVLAGLIIGRFLKIPTKALNALAGVMLLFVVLAAALPFKPTAAWLAQNGDLAQKGATLAGWKRTDPATFTRLEVLKLKRVMIQDAEVAETVMAGILAKGGTVEGGAPSVMFALDLLHNPSKGVKSAPKAPSKAASQ